MPSRQRLHLFLASSITTCLLSQISAFGSFGTANYGDVYGSCTTYSEYPISSSRIFHSSSDVDNYFIPGCEIPPFVKSPVLLLVYPAMMTHIKEFGNPNIPMGNIDGKRCQTLRRLAFQKKLSEEEIELLTEMKFRFNTLEEVYEEADFDDCLRRLVEYEQEFQTNYQIPKKYNSDPELGAWVTMIRRIGRDNIVPTHREKLDAINFAWISTRKCGSVFMKNYQSVRGRLLSFCEIREGEDEKSATVVDQQGLDSVLSDPEVKKWINAQREAAAKGNINAHRCEYLDELPGLDWRKPL